MTYTGPPAALRAEVYARDRDRCRWCGATNRGKDLHHIEYRKGYSYDVAPNLITLCRLHHGFVHGTPSANGERITKAVAQLVLNHLVATPGLTGAAYHRRLKRQWTLDGKCLRHGVERDACLDCETR